MAHAADIKFVIYTSRMILILWTIWTFMPIYAVHVLHSLYSFTLLLIVKNGVRGAVTFSRGKWEGQASFTDLCPLDDTARSLAMSGL